MHVPGEVAFNVVPPEIEQPADPALVTAKVTAPDPEPPDVVNEIEEPYVPLVEDTVKVDWDALFTVREAVLDVVDAGSPPLIVLVMYTLNEPASDSSKELITNEEVVPPETETPPFNHW